jgi:hypothetical protein
MEVYDSRWDSNLAVKGWKLKLSYPAHTAVMTWIRWGKVGTGAP